VEVFNAEPFDPVLLIVTTSTSIMRIEHGTSVHDSACVANLRGPTMAMSITNHPQNTSTEATKISMPAVKKSSLSVSSIVDEGVTFFSNPKEGDFGGLICLSFPL
jgi:hypothetical protein